MTRTGFVVFVGRRIVVLCLLLLVVSFAVFSLQYIAPGNVIDNLLGLTPRTPETVRALSREYHLDQPFFAQYWYWLRGAVTLNFGTSVQASLPVSTILRARLPTSLFLGLYAWLLAVITGVALGSTAAFRRRRTADRLIVGTAVIGLSTPAFVSSLGLIYLFGVVLGWFPVSGRGSGFGDELWHLTLPAGALALIGSGMVVRHTRAALIDVLDQDYVMFARARGLSRKRVFFTYELRNALIPVVTISGVLLAFLITGAVLVEVVFSLQGIGQLLVQAATLKDLPVLQGVTLVIAAVIMLANLAADVAYALIDPRIRLGRRS